MCVLFSLSRDIFIIDPVSSNFVYVQLCSLLQIHYVLYFLHFEMELLCENENVLCVSFITINNLICGILLCVVPGARQTAESINLD